LESEPRKTLLGCIYLGNGAQDSGSPTCAPVPVTCQCYYGRRKASAKTCWAMSPMNVVHCLYQVIDRPLFPRPLFPKVTLTVLVFVSGQTLPNRHRKLTGRIARKFHLRSGPHATRTVQVPFDKNYCMFLRSVRYLIRPEERGRQVLRAIVDIWPDRIPCSVQVPGLG